MCITDIQIGSFACHGDSIEPLTFRTDKEATQVGIARYKNFHRAAEQAKVFTDVAFVHECIEEAKPRLLPLLNATNVTLKDSLKNAEHCYQIGPHFANSAEDSDEFLRYLEKALRKDVNFYNLKTIFTGLHKLQTLQCAGTSKHSSRVKARNETVNSAVHDNGSCDGSKMSHARFLSTKDTEAVVATGSHSVCYKLLFSISASFLKLLFTHSQIK